MKGNNVFVVLGRAEEQLLRLLLLPHGETKEAAMSSLSRGGWMASCASQPSPCLNVRGITAAVCLASPV
jgi:hypothetical protein